MEENAGPARCSSVLVARSHPRGSDGWLPHSRRWRRSWLSHLVLFHWMLFSVRPTTTRSRKLQLPNLYREQDDRRCDLHVIFFHCNQRVKTIVASERAQRKRAYLPSSLHGLGRMQALRRASWWASLSWPLCPPACSGHERGRSEQKFVRPALLVLELRLLLSVRQV